MSYMKLACTWGSLPRDLRSSVVRASNHQCAEGLGSIPVGDMDVFLCPALVTWWSHLFLYHFNIFFSLTALPIPSVRCHCQGPEDHSIFLLLQYYGEHHVQWEELWLITQLHCSWLWVKVSFSLSRNLGDIQWLFVCKLVSGETEYHLF